MRKQLTIVGILSIVAAMLIGRTSSGEPDAAAPAAAPVVPAPAAAGRNPPAVAPVQPVQAVPAQVQVQGAVGGGGRRGGGGGGGFGAGGFGGGVGGAAAQGLRVEPNNGVLQIYSNALNAFGPTNPAGANQDLNPKAAEIGDAMHALRVSEDPAEKADLKMRLENALTDYFDADMKTRETELSDLEERVKKLRAQLDRRNKAKAEIIQLQLKVLNNEAEGLGFSNVVSPVSDAQTSATGNQSIFYSIPNMIQPQPPQPPRVQPPVAVPAIR